MHKIGIIGDRESVLAFKAVGFDVCDTTEYEAAYEALKSFVSQGYAIIYITEQIALLLEKEVEAYKECPTPSIIVIPNNRGSSGMGILAIKRSVEKAVGGSC